MFYSLKLKILTNRYAYIFFFIPKRLKFDFRQNVWWTQETANYFM